MPLAAWLDGPGFGIRGIVPMIERDRPKGEVLGSALDIHMLLKTTHALLCAGGSQELTKRLTRSGVVGVEGSGRA